MTISPVRGSGCCRLLDMTPARTSGTGNAVRAMSPRSSHVAEGIPEAVLQEDQKLLLWYDQALTRTEEDA